LAWVASLAACLGCHGYRDDVVALCAAESESAAPARLDAAIDRLAPTLRTSEGRALAARLRASDAEPGAILAGEARKVGLDRCPVAVAFASATSHARLRHDLETMCGYTLAQIDPSALLTDEGRALFRSLQVIDRDARRVRLGAAAREMGLSGCAQADGS
jgi:hypothetical protein